MADSFVDSDLRDSSAWACSHSSSLSATRCSPGGSTAPLMLLDDVMSELDGERRQRLVDRLLEGGQSVVTAAESDLVPDSDEFAEIRIRDLTAISSEVPS